MRGIDFVSAFHLAGHQLTVGMYENTSRTAVSSLFETAYKSFILGDVVCRLPDTLPNLDQGFPSFAGHQHTNSCRAGIALAGSVNK